MRRRLPVRVVLTGATSGIGRATALMLARRGASLAVAGRREAALEELAAQCRDLGAEALAVECDMSRPADVERLARRTVENFGGFDVWINNAGVLAIGPVEQNPARALARVVEVNLTGTMLGTRAAVAQFKQSQKGTVVNVASLLSMFPSGYAAAYAASKHGVEGFGGAVRQELVNYPGVRICNVMPAGVDTPILRHAANYSGKAIRPYYPLVAPERVARGIVRCIRRPRDKMVVGITGRIESIADAVTPGLHRKIIAIMTSFALRRASTASASDGALFDAPEGDVAVRGGLRKKRKAVRAAAAAALVLGGVAYGAASRGGRLRAMLERRANG